MNNKGSVLDLFIIGIVIVAVAFSLIISLFIMNSVKTPLVAQGANESFFTQAVAGFSLLDEVAVFVFFGAMIASVVSAFFVQSHPVFFFISIILTAVLALLGGIFSSMFTSVAVTFTESNEFPLIVWCIQNLTMLLVIFAFVISAVLYSKINATGTVYS